MQQLTSTSNQMLTRRSAILAATILVIIAIQLATIIAPKAQSCDKAHHVSFTKHCKFNMLYNGWSITHISSAYWEAGTTWLRRWILLWIMPLVQDGSLELLTRSPAWFFCTTDAPLLYMQSTGTYTLMPQPMTSKTWTMQFTINTIDSFHNHYIISKYWYISFWSQYQHYNKHRVSYTHTRRGEQSKWKENGDGRWCWKKGFRLTKFAFLSPCCNKQTWE